MRAFQRMNWRVYIYLDESEPLSLVPSLFHSLDKNTFTAIATHVFNRLSFSEKCSTCVLCTQIPLYLYHWILLILFLIAVLRWWFRLLFTRKTKLIASNLTEMRFHDFYAIKCGRLFDVNDQHFYVRLRQFFPSLLAHSAHSSGLTWFLNSENSGVKK